MPMLKHKLKASVHETAAANKVQPWNGTSSKCFSFDRDRHLDKSAIQVFYWYFIAPNSFLKAAAKQLLLRLTKMLRISFASAACANGLASWNDSFDSDRKPLRQISFRANPVAVRSDVSFIRNNNVQLASDRFQLMTPISNICETLRRTTIRHQGTDLRCS